MPDLAGPVVNDPTISPTTNITEGMSVTFDAIRLAAPEQVALFSCFVDGKPSAAIAFVDHLGNGEVNIQPLFVWITDDMVITDHDGNEPDKNPEAS